MPIYLGNNLIGNTSTSTPARTRFCSFTNGGNGSGFYTAQTLTSWSGRIPVRLPETTTRWRWVIRNNENFNPATYPTLTGTGLVMGQQASDSEGVGQGTFINNAASTILGQYSIPGDATWYRSSWITDPALQFQQGVNHLLGFGFQTATSRSYRSGAGRCWQTVNDNGVNAINPAYTAGTQGATRAGCPLEWIIEYECVTTRLTWLVLGDSIAEGITGPYGTTQGTASPVTPPLADTYPALWAERAQAQVQNLSLASITADNFANLPATWTRTDLLSPQFDGALVALGSNDFAGGRTLAQMKTSMAAIFNLIRTNTGNPNIPIYVANVIPRGFLSSGSAMTAAVNIVRQQFNDWLAQLPYGIKGCVDMDSAFSTGTGSPTTIKNSMTTDVIHPSYTGVIRLAAELRNALPPMQQAYAMQGNLYQVVTQAQFDALPAGGTSSVLYVIKD
jgi:lysophospholipase L1-like esterase